MTKKIIIACMLLCNSVSADIYQIQDAENRLRTLQRLEYKHKQEVQAAIDCYRDVQNAVRQLELAIKHAKRADQLENRTSLTTTEFSLHHPTPYSVEGTRRAGITYYGRSK